MMMMVMMMMMMVMMHLMMHIHSQNLYRCCLGTWCSGITSALYGEGPGFKSQCVQFLPGRFKSFGSNLEVSAKPVSFDTSRRERGGLHEGEC
eukprot:992139-Amphidinium_carterae.1